MVRKLRLSVEALQQIEAIGDYIAEDSLENALRWVEKLWESIVSLRTFPESHAILYTADQTGREVRQTSLASTALFTRFKMTRSTF
jgi:plasmid stabilization system protein ParE